MPAISIEFVPLFELEGLVGRNCSYDSLTISAGSQSPNDNVSPPLFYFTPIFTRFFFYKAYKVELCGSVQPSKLIFKGREVYVSFKSDDSIIGAGFSFNFTVFGKLED